MATFTVTNLFDSGAGSLRDFISTANGSDGADIIDFGTELSGTINLTSGELGISDNLTINGLGADLLSVDAGGNSRIFNVDDGDENNNLEVAIKGLMITGGNVADSSGGGIFNSEKLTVSNSTISGNTVGYGGGGIYNIGDLRVSNSTISGNTVGYGGGGIYSIGDLRVSNSTISGNTAETNGGGIGNFYSSATVTNSTISGNTAEYGGGGIYNIGDLRVTNSTISGNTAEYGGGGIGSNSSELTVTNSTISGNTAETSGGGINNNNGDLTVTNSTISSNTADEDAGIDNGSVYGGDSTATVTSSIVAANGDNKDLGGNDPFTSGGNNLIGNGDGAEGFTNGIKGDIVGTAEDPVDPLLGELQDNGGTTQTQALLPGSPAINAGSNPLNLKFDQRGPGFDRVIGAQADIGAVEVVPEPDSTLGLLGIAALGVMFLRKHRQQPKTRAKM